MNEILPIGLVVGALFALFLAFSKPVSLLPRWVRHAYLLLSVSLAAWGIVSYLKTHHQPSLSDHPYSLLLQARAWLAGFSGGILTVLIMAGVFPGIFGQSKKHEPPAT